MADIDDSFTGSLNVGKRFEQDKKEKELQKHVNKQKKQVHNKGNIESFFSNKYNLVKPYCKKYTVAIFLSIAIILAIVIRLYMANIPLMDDWAYQTVETNLREDITQEINNRYYSLSNQRQQDLIEHSLIASLEDPENILIMENKADSLRQSYMDPENNTYLYGVDSYYFYGLAENQDFSIDTPLLPLIEYYYYKIMSVSDSQLTLFGAIFYLPIIFVILCIFPIFFITRKIAGNTPAFIASVLFAIHPEFLAYSLAGMTDTNILNILFILFISWMFLEFFEFKSTKKSIITGVLALVAIVLFRYSWSGYYVSILLILSVFVIYYLMKLFFSLTDKYNKNLVLFLSLVIFILVFAGLYLLFPFLINYMPQKLQNFLHFSSTTWPDAYLTISELRPVEFSDFVYRTGGKILFVLSLIAIFYLFYKKCYEDFSENSKSTILLFIVLGVLGYTGLRALRFLPFFIVFYCIIAGIGFYFVTKYLFNLLNGVISIESGIIKLVVGLIIISVLLIPIVIPLNENFQKTRNSKPIMDDAIYNSAIEIKNISDEDAQIFVWWDKGHFYDALADRNTFLSAVPSMPRTYWMARFLEEDNEDTAKGLLDMVACGQEENYYFSSLSGYGFNNVLSEIDVSLINQTFCSHPDVYIVVIDDMLIRFNVVQHLAAWDPLVSDATSQTSSMTPNDAVDFIETNYNLNKSEANRVFMETLSEDEITDIPIIQYDCSIYEDSGQCIIGDYIFNLNLETMNVDYKSYNPLRFYYVEDGIVTEVNYTDGPYSIPYVLIVYKRVNNYHAVLVSEDVADSMFIKMLLLEGYGLDYFEKVYDYVRPETKHAVVYKLIE